MATEADPTEVVPPVAAGIASVRPGGHSSSRTLEAVTGRKVARLTASTAPSVGALGSGNHPSAALPVVTRTRPQGPDRGLYLAVPLEDQPFGSELAVRLLLAAAEDGEGVEDGRKFVGAQ